MDPFYGLDSASRYGIMPQAAPVAGGSETAYMAPSPVPSGLTGLVNPRNPLAWLLLIGLATVGAAGVAGSVRLGPAKLSGAMGKA